MVIVTCDRTTVSAIIRKRHIVWIITECNDEEGAGPAIKQDSLSDVRLVSLRLLRQLFEQDDPTADVDVTTPVQDKFYSLATLIPDKTSFSIKTHFLHPWNTAPQQIADFFRL